MMFCAPTGLRTRRGFGFPFLGAEIPDGLHPIVTGIGVKLINAATRIRASEKARASLARCKRDDP